MLKLLPETTSTLSAYGPDSLHALGFDNSIYCYLYQPKCLLFYLYIYMKMQIEAQNKLTLYLSQG